MRKTAPAAALLAMLCSAGGCYPLVPSRPKPPPPAPCTKPVSPIRNVSPIIVVLTYHYTYTAEDPSPEGHKADILAQLNKLGSPDGNSFQEANGQPVNFYMTYDLNNDGNDHFSGSLEFSGWGQGFIHRFYIGQSYASSDALTRDLTNQMYAFIHEGWHDSRPSCPQY